MHDQKAVVHAFGELSREQETIIGHEEKLSFTQ